MTKTKKYKAAKEKLGNLSVTGVALSKALEQCKEVAFAKFVESVDLSIHLNILQKHSIRGSISLPHALSSERKKVLVFAQGDQIKLAQEAGATYVGFEEYIEKIKGGWLDFDVAISTPDLMKEVSKLGPILGRKGLMPNPKVGTVTDNVAVAVKEFATGKQEYRATKTGNVQVKIGHVKMEHQSLLENAQALLQEILRKKPSDLKGDYVKSVYVSSTMGPGIRVDLQGLR